MKVLRQRNFVVDFYKKASGLLSHFLEDLRVNVIAPSLAHLKSRDQIPIVVIEHFSLSLTPESLRMKYVEVDAF